MKKKNYATVVLILIFLLLIVTGLIFYRINNALYKVEQKPGIILPDKIPAYHFAMIYKEIGDPSWIYIKKGVEKAAKEFNVAVEFNGSSSFNDDEMFKYLDIAIASKVDGIVTYVWDEEQTTSLIDRAVTGGIPLVTIGTDAKNSSRHAFVGINTYDLGLQLGRMAIAATGGTGQAVLLSSNHENGEIMESNLLLGIWDGVKQYPDIRISTIGYKNAEFLGIEDAMNQLLKEDSEFSTIICTSERDTAIVAERLVDLNKVGYHIIGNGTSIELLRYIEKGVVFGTVTGDLEQMGYEAIRALVDLKEQGRTSAYFTVDTFVITKENVDKYLESGEE